MLYNCGYSRTLKNCTGIEHLNALCNYGYSRTLKTAPVQNIDTLCIYGTPMNYAIMDTFIKHNFVIMDTHNSKATRISLKFGNIYGQYAHKYT